MKTLFILLFVFLSAYRYDVFAQTDFIGYTETKISAPDKPLKKIIVIGSGATPTRIFMDKLSEELISKFKKEKIEIQYEYIGKEKSNDTILLNSPKYTGYDALLLFETTDTAEFKSVIGRTSSVSSLGIRTSTGYTAFQYMQKFKIKLYSFSEKRFPFWTAKLSIDCNLTKTKIPKRMAQIIYKNFYTNKYIE